MKIFLQRAGISWDQKLRVEIICILQVREKIKIKGPNDEVILLNQTVHHKTPIPPKNN